LLAVTTPTGPVKKCTGGGLADDPQSGQRRTELRRRVIIGVPVSDGGHSLTLVRVGLAGRQALGPVERDTSPGRRHPRDGFAATPRRPRVQPMSWAAGAQDLHNGTCWNGIATAQDRQRRFVDDAAHEMRPLRWRRCGASWNRTSATRPKEGKRARSRVHDKLSLQQVTAPRQAL